MSSVEANKSTDHQAAASLRAIVALELGTVVEQLLK